MPGGKGRDTVTIAGVEVDADEARLAMATAINAAAGERAPLEQAYGQVWDTEELKRDFDVRGFCAPFVMVQRKADGQKGILTFQHWPRFYYSFTEEK